RRALHGKGLCDLSGVRLDSYGRNQRQDARRSEGHRSRSRARESRHSDQPSAYQVRTARVESAEGRSVGTHGVARRRGESEMTTQVQDLPKDYQYGWEDKDAIYRNKKH